MNENLIWFVTIHNNSTKPCAQGIYTSAKKASIELATIGVIQGNAEETTLYNPSGDIACMMFTTRDYQATLTGMPLEIAQRIINLDKSMWNVPDMYETS